MPRSGDPSAFRASISKARLMRSTTERAHAGQLAPMHDALRLVWQQPATHRFIDVGRLTDLGEGRYGFEYTEGAHGNGFFPLSEFPDLDESYTCNSFPAFFANRVMSSRRGSYRTYLGWLGLADVPTPMEILARTGGSRVTDTFHVVDSFQEHDGRRMGRFFASGISHIDGVDQRLAALHSGDVLDLRDDTTNPANPQAILLDAHGQGEVGWVPDWLLNDVHAMRGPGSSLTIAVDQVNLDAPPHLQLLCRLSAVREGHQV